MRIISFFFGAIVMIWAPAEAGIIRVGKGYQVIGFQDAIHLARPGDTLLLGSQVFYETNVSVDKPLTIFGQKNTIIDGEGRDEILAIHSDSVTIKGLTLRNTGYSFVKDRAGIHVVEKDYIRIEDCRLEDTFFGIFLQKANHVVLKNNILIARSRTEEAYTGNGIHLWYCENITVKKNTIRYHRDGIYLEFVNNSRVIDNLSENNIRYGLHFMFSNYDEYINNTFRENGTGVAVMFSKWITMNNNRFINNWGNSSFGLLLKEIYDGELTNNLFENNTVAIHAEGANRIRIQGNHIENNGWAMKMMGSCFDNEITENNFIGNNFNISTNTKKISDDYSLNYWDDYAGYDLDKDGVGDVPHRPVKLFAYVVERVPVSVLLMRSMFIELVNLAEYVVPSLTPENLIDSQPTMKPYGYDYY